MKKELELTKLSDFRISYSNTAVDQTTSIHHYHDAYEIVFYMKADLKIFIKDFEYQINDGDLFFINEYDIHHILYNATPHYIRYVIHFKKDYILPMLKASGMEGILEQLALRPYKKVHPGIKAGSELQALFEAVHKATGYTHNPHDESSNARVLSNLLLLLLRVRELLDAEKSTEILTKNGKLVQDIIRYIDANFMNPIGLDQLAVSLFSNKYYICHLFKKKTGISIMEYVQYRRTLEAQKLLEDTDKDILSVYYDCGFNNVQHFYRVFRKISKVTPSQYRKLHRKK